MNAEQELDDAVARWWCVELRRFGEVTFAGRVEAMAADMRAQLGPAIELSPNGRALIFGPPRK